MTNKENSDFKRLASDTRVGLAREIFGFLVQTKKWWLLPIIIILSVVGALVVLSGTAAAPFIYTLF